MITIAALEIPDCGALQDRFANIKVHDISEKKLPTGKKHVFGTLALAERLKASKDACKDLPLTVRRILNNNGD